MSSFSLSVVSFVMGVLCAALYIAWWFLTRKISSDTYIVDERGNDIMNSDLVGDVVLENRATESYAPSE